MTPLALATRQLTGAPSAIAAVSPRVFRTGRRFRTCSPSCGISIDRLPPQSSGSPPKIPLTFALISRNLRLMALTRRQREIYDFICDFVREKGYSPSLEEIGAHFGLRSVATVHKHVQHLVEKDFLQKAWNRSRSVEPVGSGQVAEASAGLNMLPMLGTVAAGAPIEAIENPEPIAVPPDLVGRGEHFVLEVRGDSMIEDQICDGDKVIIESRSEARNGETVVALVGGTDATLKRFYREGSKVKLVPANSTMDPIEVNAADVTIRGVLRGLIRSY
jgi:repressor LexA